MKNSSSLLGKLSLIFAMLRAAQQEYGTRFFATATRFWKLDSLEFSPSEMAQFHLLDTNRGSDYLNRFISNESFLRIQKQLNPAALAEDTEDKLAFHQKCIAGGLPVPALIAVFFPRELRGVNAANQSLEGASYIAGLLQGMAAGQYVLKPVNGTGGSGVEMIDWAGPNSLQDIEQKISSHFCANSGFSTWIMQERLNNHPKVLELSPSRALQTTRIVTFVEDNGDVNIIAAQTRLALSNAVVDNFSNPITPGMLGNINLASGVIEVCWRQKSYPLEFGMEVLEYHPETREKLPGAKVPCWEELKTTARQAALVFRESRCLGWDIAVSEKGAYIIEANRYWDPHNEDGKMGRLTASLAAKTGITLE